MTKRLHHLETRAGFDASGYAPRSEGWWIYWSEEVDRVMKDQSDAKIPFEVIGAIIHRAEEERANARSAHLEGISPA
jgi:hypothetical protein